jgi:isopenicillin N synthase-like dioxygenase
MTFSEIPLVDISAWFSGSAQERKELAGRVNDVCAQVGFLYLSGHDVPQQSIDGCFAVARDFFALPRAEKLKLSAELTGGHRGYVAPGTESTDIADLPDKKEAWDMGLVLDPGDAEPRVAARMGAPNLWPPTPANFKPVVMGYFEAALNLARTMFEIFAAGFGLDESEFADDLTRPIAQMRLIHYAPSDPRRYDGPGIGAHTDYEALTILAQDKAGGLEVQNEAGEWVAAPFVPGTFVVNVGDLLAHWTNGVFTATNHRVLNNSGVERYSIPLFFGPNYDTVIEPMAACVSDDKPAAFPRITAGRYLADRLIEVNNRPSKRGVS